MAFSRYYRHKLNNQQKKIYDDLVVGLENRACEVHTDFLSGEDIPIITHAVNFDNPQLYYVDFSKITIIQSMGMCKILVSYLISLDIL